MHVFVLPTMLSQSEGWCETSMKPFTFAGASLSDHPVHKPYVNHNPFCTLQKLLWYVADATFIRYVADAALLHPVVLLHPEMGCNIL